MTGVLQMKNDEKYWFGLIGLGTISLLNAFISTIFRPNVLLHDNQVIAVHWINTIILLAGLAPIVFPQKTLRSETAIVVTNLLSLCISSSCAFADICNIFIRVFGKKNSTNFFSHFIGEDEVDIPYQFPSEQAKEFMAEEAIKYRQHLFTYNCIDLAICVIAACLSHQIIANRINISPSSHMTDSRKLQGFGIALIILTILGIFNYAWQRLIMIHHKLAIFLDMHTIDEFSWLIINLATAVFVFLSSKGNQIIQNSALVLSGATIYPSFFYSWLDYRIMTSTHSRFLFKQAMISLSISIPHIAVLLTIFLFFTSSLRETVQVHLEKLPKIIFCAFSFFFLIITLSLVDVSFYALFTKQFYRIFHSSEQKLPFLVGFLSLFSGLSVVSKFNFLTISISLIIGIMTVNATYLHTFSYIYLRWNGYFMAGQNLDFLMLPSDRFENGTETSMVHTIETSLNVISMIAAFSLVVFVMVLARSHTSNSEIVEETENLVEKTKNERKILIIGCLMLICSLILLLLAIFIFISSNQVHPLVTIYSQIFQIVLGMSITSFALFQVLISENLSKYPIYSCSLLIISIVRALDILTQIDYKDTDGQPIAWTIHASVEYFMIFAHFMTISYVLHAQGPGRALIEPAEIPMNFENPLGNGGIDENGYIMLRTNENTSQ